MKVLDSKKVLGKLNDVHKRGRKTLCEMFFDARQGELTRRKIELVVIQCLTGGRIIKELSELILDSMKAKGLKEFDPKKIFGINPSKVFLVDDHVIADPNSTYAAASEIESLGCKMLGFNYIGKGNGNLHDVAIKYILETKNKLLFGVSADSHGQEWAAVNGTGCIPGGMDYIIKCLLDGFVEMKVLPSIKISLIGNGHIKTDIRNVFFYLAKEVERLGIEPASYCLEFEGSGWEILSIDQKRVLANLCTDLDFRMVLGSDSAIRFIPAQDAEYKHIVKIYLPEINDVYVCVPSNGFKGIKSIEEIQEPIIIDRVRVESCSGAHLDDIKEFCDSLEKLWREQKKESIIPKLTITPAGPDGFDWLIKSGWRDRLLKHNVEIYPAGCGGCIGILPKPADGDVVFSTAARAHQKGRLGNDNAIGYTGGPQLAAYIAVFGYIGDYKYGSIPSDPLTKLSQLCLSFESSSDRIHPFDSLNGSIVGKCYTYPSVSSDMITPGSAGSERINFQTLRKTAFVSLNNEMQKRMLNPNGLFGSILATESYCVGASSRQEAAEVMYDSGLVVLAVQFGAIQKDNAVKRGVPIGIITEEVYQKLSKMKNQEIKIDLVKQIVFCDGEKYHFSLIEPIEKIMKRDPRGDVKRIIEERI